MPLIEHMKILRGAYEVKVSKISKNNKSIITKTYFKTKLS